jgi:hypothetical protein
MCTGIKTLSECELRGMEDPKVRLVLKVIGDGLGRGIVSKNGWARIAARAAGPLLWLITKTGAFRRAGQRCLAGSRRLTSEVGSMSDRSPQGVSLSLGPGSNSRGWWHDCC